MSALVLVVVSCFNEETVKPDKSELKTAIDEAIELVSKSREGIAPGTYKRGSKAILQVEIKIAQIVLDLPEATAPTISAATLNLKAAIQAFRNNLILPLDSAILVGHWTFDEIGIGTSDSTVLDDTVRDYSGNNRHGKIKAGNKYFNSGKKGLLPVLTKDRYGIPGRALYLNRGANVEIPYSLAVNPPALSIMAWVLLSERRKNRFIGLHSWNGYRFEVDSLLFPAMALRTTDGKTFTRAANKEAGLNSWYHLAVTFKAGEMKFYMNGSLVRTWLDVTKSVITLPVPYNLVLGCDFPTDQYATDTLKYKIDKKIPVMWGGYLNGSLDEVRLYKVALTPDQVTDIYELERPN